MTRIGILSDTHGFLDPRVFEHFKDVDEIWHAGDLGTLEVYDQLRQFKPFFRAVHGNIDGYDIRLACPEFLRFRCEQVDVLMTHIGGYPSKYSPQARMQIAHKTPHLFVCGHSHILKVMFDRQYQMLCVNPGAAGRYGQQPVPTLIKLTIDGAEMKDLDVIELA